MTLHNVLVLPQPSQFDVVGDIGNVGRSLWSAFDTATIDFGRRLLILR